MLFLASSSVPPYIVIKSVEAYSPCAPNSWNVIRLSSIVFELPVINIPVIGEHGSSSS